jgi:hypothetical protein
VYDKELEIEQLRAKTAFVDDLQSEYNDLKGRLQVRIRGFFGCPTVCVANENVVRERAAPETDGAGSEAGRGQSVDAANQQC